MDFLRPLGARMRNWIWEAGLLLVLPLAFYRGFTEQFSTPKSFLTKYLIIIGLTIWGLDCFWRSASRPFKSSLRLPLLVFSFAALISCCNSPVPGFSLLEVELVLCGPAWVLLLVSWDKGEWCVRRIASLIGIAGALVAGIALVQRVGYDPLLLGGYRINWGTMVARMRMYSTLGNPNFVGGYLIGAIFPPLALGVVSRARWAKALWSAIALVMGTAVVGAGSRGSWFGLAVGLAVAALIVFPPSGSRTQEDKQLASGAGSQIFGFVFPVWCWPAALLTLPLIERLVLQLRGRLYLWRFSWPILAEHPIMGSGWGTYQLLYLEFQGKFLAAHPEYLRYWTNNRLLHNDPLQLLLEAGLLGLAGLVWVLWEYGREARRVLQQAATRSTGYWIAASAGGTTAILADSLFNFQFAVPPTFILFFTLLAFPPLLQRPAVEEGSEGQPAAVPRTRQGTWPHAVRWVGALVLLTATGDLLWQQTRLLFSERAYRVASILEEHDNLAGAEEAYRRSVELNPSNGRAHFGLSRVFYMTGRFSEAMQEVVLAERTYTDSHEEVLRARILDQTDRGAEALAAYRHARYLDPTLTSIQADIERLSNAR